MRSYLRQLSRSVLFNEVNSTPDTQRPLLHPRRNLVAPGDPADAPIVRLVDRSRNGSGEIFPGGQAHDDFRPDARHAVDRDLTLQQVQEARDDAQAQARAGSYPFAVDEGL